LFSYLAVLFQNLSPLAIRASYMQPQVYLFIALTIYCYVTILLYSV